MNLPLTSRRQALVGAAVLAATPVLVASETVRAASGVGGINAIPELAPQWKELDLAEILKVSERTVFRDLAELQRIGFPVTFGNGYPAQQELFKRRRRQEMAQVLADLVDQQLEVVRRKMPPEEADRVVAEAIQYLPMEAAEAVTRALAKAAQKSG